MEAKFDRWTLLKLIEVILVTVCLIFKRVTDDEASRLFLYLQKLSREWSLLNNITWSKVGAAVADATFGGYLIITVALFIGRLLGELPTQKRITEFILLGVGAVLFVALGSLAYAALDSVPPDLVDNAAIVGTVSLVTGALFLLDMGGPKARKLQSASSRQRKAAKPTETKSITQQVFEIEKEIKHSERKHLDTFEPKTKTKKESKNNGIKNGRPLNGNGGGMIELEHSKGTKGYQPMKDDLPRRFGIYGKDIVDGAGSETDDTEIQLPPQMEPHSPVWSHIRKGQYGNYDIISSPITLPKRKDNEDDDDRPPSRPGDRGYVQHVAQHWGERSTKTPRPSPTQV